MFFRADYVRERRREIASALPADTRWVVVDAGASAQMDSAAAAMLKEVPNSRRGEFSYVWLSSTRRHDRCSKGPG